LLICALAVAPCLEEAERAALQVELAELWARGVLVLPGDAPRLERGTHGWQLVESVERDVVLERVQALGASPGFEARMEESRERRSLQALEAMLGSLPEPSSGEKWMVIGRGEALFACRRAAESRVEGHFVDVEALAQRLAQRVDAPRGFVLDTSSAGDGEGQLVRDRVPLAGETLGFRLRHADPASLARDERRRLLALRASLLALAVFIAGASFFAVRAMRRERRLTELKSAFVAGVSHDLRTPLASILLLAENLEGGSIDEATARERYYPTIRREAARLRRLVDDALDFSRLERGEAVRVAREVCELSVLERELLAEATERVESAGGSLNFEAHGLDGEAVVDAFALRRAVWNLIENALEHSGSKEIGLRLERESEELIVEVSDRGRGVPGALVERIFDPYASFVAAGRGNGSATPGTGLGLAIVRAIARAHGGEVSVRAGSEGVGAVFALRLGLGDDA
jgi:signal transduction histidine kinase